MTEELAKESLKNEVGRTEFEKILIEKIPKIEDVGQIKLTVNLNYGEKKSSTHSCEYEIDYKTITPSGEKKLPYLELTIKGKGTSKLIKLRFTNKAKLEIYGEGVGLLGGGFTLYNIDGLDKGKGLALDDDCGEHFEKEITYQTFSNFDAASFEKDYLFSDSEKKGKVIISLTIKDKSVGDLWSQNSDTNGWEWIHRVPSFVDSDSGEKYGKKLLLTMVSNALLRLMAFNFNLPDDKREDSKKENIFNELPTKNDLKDVRPVDLDAIKINEELKSKNLHFRWNTISSICASLNSGKNVILVGPPGCGKTKLAVEIAKYGMKGNEDSALLCTASPAWTTGDLVGRYLPSPDGLGLIFDEGFFLKAIDKDKWLIVDEINRANIDSCFGELFSILSNQSVELPFKVEVEEDDKKAYKPVGVVPSTEERRDKYKDYKVPASFRMIGTMNDADRGQLTTLSFALQRRFNTLYMDPPTSDTIAKIINTHFNNCKENVWGEKSKYLISVGNIKTSDSSYMTVFKEQYLKLFGGEKGLVSENVIGVSILLDSMKFAFEGLRNEDQLKVGVNEKEAIKVGAGVFFRNYMKSWVAKSLVSLLFPQLGAVSDEKLEITLKTLKMIFDGTPLINLIKTTSNSELVLSEDEEFKTIDNFLSFYLKKHIDEQKVDDTYLAEKAE